MCGSVDVFWFFLRLWTVTIPYLPILEDKLKRQKYKNQLQYLPILATNLHPKNGWLEYSFPFETVYLMISDDEMSSAKWCSNEKKPPLESKFSLSNTIWTTFWKRGDMFLQKGWDIGSLFFFFQVIFPWLFCCCQDFIRDHFTAWSLRSARGLRLGDANGLGFVVFGLG